MIHIYPIPSVTSRPLDIIPASKTRDWFVPHAYKCTPLTCANTLGWDLVLNQDVIIEWNGGVYKKDVTIVQGSGVDSQFGMGTFTINVGHIWRTEENINLMVFPVPNSDNTEIQSMTAVMETDWLSYPWFLTIRLINKGRTLIKRGTPVARVIPINTGYIENTKIYRTEEPENVRREREGLTEKRNSSDEWTKDYFRKARRFVRCNPVIDHSDYYNLLENNGILTKESFLNEEECSYLIRNFKPENNDDPYLLWRGRLCWSAMESNKGVIEDRILRFAREMTGLNLTIDNPHIVHWPADTEMPPHNDLGAMREFPNRNFAAIVYLNDNYQGGELMFPDLGFGIKGHAGELIIFRGDSIMHGVNKINSGNRYTIASWLTING